MGTILASDWSSDVRSHVMGGNRGPVVKRDRGLTGSHVMGGNRGPVVKRDRGLREVTWFGKPLTRGKKGIAGSPEVT